MGHNETVYALLKTALWGAERYPIPTEEGIDWAAVHKELSDHAVDGLAVDTLAMLPGAEPALRQEWIMKSTRSMMFWHRIMGEQQEICDMLRDAKIPFAVLKGAAADIYYPKPEYRTMGDIDLIVRLEDFDRAAALVKDRGWTAIGDSERHLELKKNGVMLELHRYFATSADADAAKALDTLVFGALDDAPEVSLDRYRFVMLPPQENGLVLLEHIAQHLRDGLGLRQIIDWMMFVERELDDGRWQAAFQLRAKAIGLETLAVTVTRMCQMYLGLREEGITWCMAADEVLCQELMDVTMARGNFGRKQGDYSTVVNVVNRLSDWRKIPQSLQMRGEYNWKALKKYPWLRPFAWLYQICRYIRRGLARKNPFWQLGADVRSVSRENLLWDRLGVEKRKEARQFTVETTEQN